MISQPTVVFCLMDNNKCPLRKVMSSALDGHNGSYNGGNRGNDYSELVLNIANGIAGRILRAHYYPEEKYLEIWLRVSAAWPLLKVFENKLKQENGVAFQVIYSNKFNTIYRVLIDASKCPCILGERKCLVLHPVPGVMLKSSVISPHGLLCELIVSKSSALNELRQRGCRILIMHGIEEYDYMLTHKQELAVLYAYLTGYYQFPRKVSLKDLSAKLGLSVSTIAELIRKAEAKIVEVFIRHELPHYLVGLVMSKSTYKDFIENKFFQKNGKAKSEERKERIVLKAEAD